MMVVFEVFLAPGADPSRILSAELQRETGAQVMTLDEARKVGFAGLKDSPGQEVRLIAVKSSDRAWILRTLESSDAVGSFRMHEID